MLVLLVLLGAFGGVQAYLDQMRVQERRQELQHKYAKQRRLAEQNLRELSNLTRQEKCVPPYLRVLALYILHTPPSLCPDSRSACLLIHTLRIPRC